MKGQHCPDCVKERPDCLCLVCANDGFLCCGIHDFDELLCPMPECGDYRKEDPSDDND